MKNTEEDLHRPEGEQIRDDRQTALDAGGWPLNAFRYGDVFTKCSYVVFGLGNLARGQIVKGLIFLALEASFFVFLIRTGLHNLSKFATLGTQKPGIYVDPKTQIPYHVAGDNSMLILLGGIVTIFVILCFLALWGAAIKSAYLADLRRRNGGAQPRFSDDLRSLLDGNIHKLLMAVPVLGLLLFTVIPIVYMIVTAFTDFDYNHQPPGFLFTWVGWQTFRQVFSTGSALGQTFWPILGWTMIWAVFSTFTCYFSGLLLAMLIDKKEIRFKKMWRTILVTTMAIPTFVSLLLMQEMLQPQGALNILLEQWGFIHNPLPFLSDPTWARVTVIVVNMWIGIPSSMLIATGILTNISPDQYESARLDGANAVQIFWHITLPYVLFVTTPYLITAFVANINNFSVIYLLTGGGPATLDYYKGAGKTDLLVTWLYRLTASNWDYCFASAIGIVVFILCAAFSIVLFRRTVASQNEEEYQQ